MSNPLAIVYPRAETAHLAADALLQLQFEQALVLDQLVVAELRRDGRVRLHQRGRAGLPPAAVVDRVCKELEPGSGAILVELRSAAVDRVLPRISALGGEVVGTSPDAEPQRHLGDALGALPAAA